MHSLFSCLNYFTMKNLQIIIILLCFINLFIAQASKESDNLFLSEEQENIFTNGVAVDYSFNETLSQLDSLTKLISVPGCPVSTEPGSFKLHEFDRHFWVHHGFRTRCYLVGTQGPCPNGTLMGPLKNSKSGICVCSCFFYSRTTPFQLTEESLCYDSKEGQHYAFINGTCHTILSQGPCKPTEVLLFDGSKNSPVCKLRDCPKKDIAKFQAPKYSFKFKINNTCHGVGDGCNLRPEETNRSPTGFYSFASSPYYWEFDVKYENAFPSCVQKYRAGHFYLGGGLNEYSCNEQLEKYSQVLKRCVPIGFFGRSSSIG